MNRILFATGLVALMAVTCTLTAADEEKPGKFKGKFDPAQMVTKMFEKADADSDGKVSKEEYTKFTEEMAAAIKARTGKGGEGKGPDAATRFTAMDTDKDGYLSKEEMTKAMAERMKGFGGKGKRGEGKPGEPKPEPKSDKEPAPQV